MRTLYLLAAASCLALPSCTPEAVEPWVADTRAAIAAMVPPVDCRERYRNRPDAAGAGSCVQASLGYCGLVLNVDALATLLENSEYGPPVLGGSWPERVKEYCAQRRVDIVSVEGQPTVAAIEQAALNGRPVAITYGDSHMIVCLGVSDEGHTFWLWDNNDPTANPRPVDRQTFERQHRATGGGWCVIPIAAAPAPWVPPGGAKHDFSFDWSWLL
jgi:hypothetical protein